MRILWQNEHYPDIAKGGGGAINTYYIVTAMQDLGHDVVVLARGPAGAEPLREEVKGTTVQRLSPPKLPDHLWPLWPLLEPRYMRSGLEKICEGFDAFIGIDYSFALNARKFGLDRPMIYRVEGNERSHEASVVTVRNGNRRTISERKISFIRGVLAAERELMERRVWARSNAIVVKSGFMKRELKRWYNLEMSKVFVIPNGVDYQRYADARPTLPTLVSIGNSDHRKIVIMFCGRLVPMKNVSFLLRAFASMTAVDRCVLAIVGDGQERGVLEQEACHLGVADRVRFVGFTDRVEEFLTAADIFVLPSLYEPFGNALVESMAAGIPSVALHPDEGRIRTASDEILEDGVTGYLVSGAGHEELSRTLDRLASDATLRRRLGAAAQVRCREKYNWRSCAQAYLSLVDRFREESKSFEDTNKRP
jgi:glycosyltransferase involved in cell wall biosynthesis